MPIRADIAVYGKNDSLQLLVEVKSKREKSREWGAKYRRNMYAHGLFPEAPFFLLALPEDFYLWKLTDSNQLKTDLIEPTFVIDAGPILSQFYNGKELDKPLSSSSLEIIITSWLRELMFADKSNYQSEFYNDWLIDSGLFDAIHRGYIKTEVLV